MKRLLVLLLVSAMFMPTIAQAEGSDTRKFSDSRCSSVVFHEMVFSSCLSWKIHNVVTQGRTVLYLGRFEGEEEIRTLAGELISKSEWSSSHHTIYDREGTTYEIRQNRSMNTYSSGPDDFDLRWKYLYTFAGGEVRLEQRWVMGDKEF